MIQLIELKKIAKLIRYWILSSTTQAGSGHPTSCLSAVELMVGLFFSGRFRFDLENPEYIGNDRLIFSKGHAAPLLYSLWAAAGAVKQEALMTLRKFDSPLEGHPTPVFPYVEAATGSLGQGLSIGLGLALNAKYLDFSPYRTFVLLGDGEMAEGSQWEAIQLAGYYKLNNLVGILDVNRLGQCGQTICGHSLKEYARRISSFGWKTIMVNGHNLKQIISAYDRAFKSKAPTMIIAKTLKGKGISFLQDKNGWHGRVLSSGEFKKAIGELGRVDVSIRGRILKPKSAEKIKPRIIIRRPIKKIRAEYKKGQMIATRKVYGRALARIFPRFPELVALDAEVSNSTYTETFKKIHPKSFFEMFIAEQNMVGAALGLARQGKIPFVSSFAAFLTRAHDQIRMIQYSSKFANVKFVGSHAGVFTGQDGPSQMGLEDLAMFRSVLNSVVFYPADAVAMEKLVERAAEHFGLVYIRTTRQNMPVIYDCKESFVVGGSKTLKQSQKDVITVVAAGITLHQTLAAYWSLKKQGILIRVIDLYCIKPVDKLALVKAAKETKCILTVEDHFAEGGLGEAVRGALTGIAAKIYSLAVKKIPGSGTPEQLLDYEEISQKAVIEKIKELV